MDRFAVNGVFAIPAASELRLHEGNWSFWAGEENRLLAWSIQRWLAADDAAGPRLLAIHGPPGCGKSLLLQLLAAELRLRNAATQIVISDGATFARDYARAHTQGQHPEWREAIRQANFLLVDDLDSLAGYPAAQDELRRTIDVLERRGSQVLVFSRAAVANLGLRHGGLIGRLQAGLCLAIEPAQTEVRAEIARRFALGHHLRLESEAATWLAGAVTGSVGDLVVQLAALSEFLGRHQVLDLASVTQFWRQRRGASRPSLAELTRLAARQLGVSVAEVRGPCRRRSVVLARGLAMYLARQRTQLSLSEIGEYFSGRDHSTVWNQCQKLALARQTNPRLQAHLEAIEARISALASVDAAKLSKTGDHSVFQADNKPSASSHSRSSAKRVSASGPASRRKTTGPPTSFPQG